MKMKELEERTGVGRESIRFYIREGLLPEPEKPKRNVATYSEEHVIRLKAIKTLQEERYLPLSVIRAGLNSDDGLTQLDAQAFPGVDALLASAIDSSTKPAADETIDALATRLNIKVADIEGLKRIGAISIKTKDGMRLVEARDVKICETWAQFRDDGFTEDSDYSPDDWKIYVEFIDWLAQEEVRLFYDHFSGQIDSEQAVVMAQRGMNVVIKLIEQLRTNRILDIVKQINADGRDAVDLNELSPPRRQ